MKNIYIVAWPEKNHIEGAFHSKEKADFYPMSVAPAFKVFEFDLGLLTDELRQRPVVIWRVRCVDDVLAYDLADVEIVAVYDGGVQLGDIQYVSAERQFFVVADLVDNEINGTWLSLRQ